MIDDQIILRIERLRDDVEALSRDIRSRYKGGRQVVAASVRQEAARVAEAWMVEIGPREDVLAVLEPDTAVDLNIQFQRLLIYSEKSVLRSKYDAAFRVILKDFRARVVVPLKAKRAQGYPAMRSALAKPEPQSMAAVKSVFVGHSFDKKDKPIVDSVVRLFTIMGVEVVTGEKPRADRVSSKVRMRIEACDAFVGIFMRRDKIVGKQEWTTSAWIIDEKAYALAKGKKLILIKEHGISSIGGLQGDYEYLEFSRDRVDDLVLRLLELARSTE